MLTPPSRKCNKYNSAGLTVLLDHGFIRQYLHCIFTLTEHILSFLSVFGDLFSTGILFCRYCREIYSSLGSNPAWYSTHIKIFGNQCSLVCGKIHLFSSPSIYNRVGQRYEYFHGNILVLAKLQLLTTNWSMFYSSCNR